MNKFGWFMCGMFCTVLIILVMFSYLKIGSANDRLLMFSLSVGGIGLMVLSQEDKKLKKKQENGE